jgi:Family of unknown function (DUF6713)
MIVDIYGALMYAILEWLYFTELLILIVHEIDSGYWKEWELFRLPGGETLFLILHFPLVGILIYGLLQINNHNPAGIIYAIVLAAIGIFAFFIHRWFISKGNEEFTTVISQVILWLSLIISIPLMYVSLQFIF